MEIVIMVVVATAFFVSTLGLALFLGLVTGLWYSKYYYDASEANGCRRWPSLQRWLSVNVFHYMKRYYFGYTVIYRGTPDLEEKVARYQGSETAIFACSPHGLFAISSFFLVGVPDYHTRSGLRWKRVRACTHRHVFAIPVLREIALWLGAINADRVNIEAMLEKSSIMLAPGGTREMIIDRETGPIQSVHKGFLRIAFAKKKLVFPVLHTGQENVFPSYSCSLLDRIRRAILGITGYPFPTFFIGPLPCQLTTYIFDAHDPSEYENEEVFISSYYAKIFRYHEEVMTLRQSVSI